MTPELNPIGFSDYSPSSVVFDRGAHPLTAGIFDVDLSLPTFNDVAFPQPAFWLGQPSPPPADESFSPSLWEMRLDTQTAEQNAFPFLSIPPGVSSIHPQGATVPADDVASDYGPRNEDVAPTDSIRLHVEVPTMPSLAPSVLLAATFPANWIKIQQRGYKYGSRQLDFERSETIHFSTKNHPGINLSDALHKDLSSLNGKDDPMLQGTSGVISCRLLFPGYPDNGSSCQIHTLNWTKTRIPIPRGKLAHEVARKVDRYLTRMAGVAPDRSIGDRWRIGQGFMNIGSMYLVSLVSVSKGSFQPEIWVAVPSTSRV